MMISSMAIFASAATITTLTTTVPAASYTLNIPADQKIPFGATKTDIGNVTVTNSTGFAVGKNLQVTVTYDAFTCDGVSTTIPFVLRAWNNEAFADGQRNVVNIPTGNHLTFYGESDNTVGQYAKEEFGMYAGSGSVEMELADIDYITLNINSEDWGKALGGDYTATITFTCKVVVEQ